MDENELESARAAIEEMARLQAGAGSASVPPPLPQQPPPPLPQQPQTNLIACPDCCRSVSPRAVTCPDCGCPIATAPVPRQVKDNSGGPVENNRILIIAGLTLFLGLFWVASEFNADSTTKPKPANTPAVKGALTSDFELLSCSPKWEYADEMYVYGEIKNNGSIAAGVKVEAIARDKDGKLVGSRSFWPNSVSNIPPGGTCGIRHPITKDKSATQVEIKVIDVNTWK